MMIDWDGACGVALVLLSSLLMIVLAAHVF